MRGVILVLVTCLVVTSLTSPLPLDRSKCSRAERARDVRRQRDELRRPDDRAIEDYKLPTNVRPLHYDIHLIPYLETPANLNFTFDGEMKILVHVDEPTDSIRLHGGYDLTVIKDSVTVTKQGIIGEQVGVLLVVQSAPNDDRDFLTIQLTSVLERGVNYTLAMSFYGHINDNFEGFYRTYYTDDQGTQRWLAVTHFQTVSARRAFPCWDEPAWKAEFKMHIAHDEEHTALSNMPAISDSESVPGRPQWRYTEFDTTPAMSSYLVAFLVSDFEALTHPTQPTYKVWTAPGRTQQATYGSDVAPKLVNYMQYFTGIQYMLPKMDQVAVPQFASGAMENWGLLTYRDDLMLHVEGVSGARDRENTEAIVAHEVSHQWFGDLVSPMWWDNLWLNEGFARYFEYNGLIDIESTWEIEERFVYEQMHYVFFDDALNETHPMFVEGVDSPYATYDMFDSISYSKGACIVRFMINLMGKENFMTGINSYLLQNQYGNADMDSLWSALEPAIPPGVLPAGVSFKQVMDSWTKQPGYPVIRVIRDYASNTALVTQKRFVTDVEQSYPEIYHAPITLTTELEANFDDLTVVGWQSGPELIIDIPASSEQWAIINLKETGYYRVNYDTTNWNLLANGLRVRPRDFHQISRGQLLNDALTLADNGELDYTSALAMTDYLAQETDFMPWATAKDSMIYVNLRMDATPENRQLYAAYMTNRLSTVYNLVNGFSISDSDGHVIQLMRPDILSWSCALDDVACNTDGGNLFQTWVNTPNPDINNPIPGDLRTVTYCAGMRQGGGTTEYDFLMARYAATDVLNYVEQERIESALGCAADTAILTRYLQDSINPSSVLKGRFCMYAVIDNHRGVDLALDFLIANWDAARDTYGGYTGIERTFIYLGPKLNTQEQRNKLQIFLDENSLILLGARVGVEEAIATLDTTLAWHAQHGAEVTAYFQNNP